MSSCTRCHGVNIRHTSATCPILKQGDNRRMTKETKPLCKTCRNRHYRGEQFFFICNHLRGLDYRIRTYIARVRSQSILPLEDPRKAYGNNTPTCCHGIVAT